MKRPVNKAGRPIWFAPSADGGGTYRPVGRTGCILMLLSVAWLLACALVCMVGFAFAPDGRWFVAMFVAGGAGLATFATLVFRHS